MMKRKKTKNKNNSKKCLFFSKNIFQSFIATISVSIFALTTEFEKAQEESYHIHVKNCRGNDVFVRSKSLHNQTGVINDIHAVQDGEAHRN